MNKMKHFMTIGPGRVSNCYPPANKNEMLSNKKDWPAIKIFRDTPMTLPKSWKGEKIVLIHFHSFASVERENEWWCQRFESLLSQRRDHSQSSACEKRDFKYRCLQFVHPYFPWAEYGKSYTALQWWAFTLVYPEKKNIYNIGFHRRGMSGNLRPSLYSASSVQILNRVKLTLDSGFGVVVPSLRLTYFVFFWEGGGGRIHTKRVPLRSHSLAA